MATFYSAEFSATRDADLNVKWNKLFRGLCPVKTNCNEKNEITMHDRDPGRTPHVPSSYTRRRPENRVSCQLSMICSLITQKPIDLIGNQARHHGRSGFVVLSANNNNTTLINSTKTKVIILSWLLLLLHIFIISTYRISCFSTWWQHMRRMTIQTKWISLSLFYQN